MRKKNHNNISLDLLRILCPKDIEKINKAWNSRKADELLTIVQDGLFNELKDYLKAENNKIEGWHTYVKVNNHKIQCDPADYQQLIERVHGESFVSFNCRPDKTQNIQYDGNNVMPEYISIRLHAGSQGYIRMELLEDDHLYLHLYIRLDDGQGMQEKVSTRLMEKEKKYFAFTKTLSLNEGKTYLHALRQKLKTSGGEINIPTIIQAMKYAQNEVERKRLGKTEVEKRELNEEDGESTDSFFQLRPDDAIICECCGFTLNYSHSDKGIH